MDDNGYFFVFPFGIERRRCIFSFFRAIGVLVRSGQPRISLVEYKFIFYLAFFAASWSSLLKLSNNTIPRRINITDVYGITILFSLQLALHSENSRGLLDSSLIIF